MGLTAIEHAEGLESTAAALREWVAAGYKLPPGRKVQTQWRDNVDTAWGDDWTNGFPKSAGRETSIPHVLYFRFVDDKPAEPAMVPFTFEDREQLRGRWIRGKDGFEECITSATPAGCNGFTYRELLDEWVFCDTGLPAGKVAAPQLSQFPNGTKFIGTAGVNCWIIPPGKIGVFVSPRRFENTRSVNTKDEITEKQAVDIINGCSAITRGVAEVLERLNKQ